MYLNKYILIFLRFFIIHFNVIVATDQINVGTVLFTKKDTEKKCWNDEQIALLRARLIYQDILPKTTLIDLKNDEFLNALIHYFHLAVNKVKRLSDGRTQRINLMAMCDVLDNNGFIYIPVPYFDSKTTPSAIAIPFKENPLRNLDHKNAIYCLSNFYLIAKKCLQDKHASDDNIQKFNRDFEKFLDTQVFPHLTDEKIYPAFGGVFRIKNELNRKIEKRKLNPELNKVKVNSSIEDESGSDEDESGSDEDDDGKAPIIVIVCLCVVTLLWLCITFYYFVKNRKITAEKTIMTDDGNKRDDGNTDDGKKRSSSIIEIPVKRKSTKLSDFSNPDKSSKTKIQPQADDSEASENKPQPKKRCLICARNAVQYGGPITPCPKCKNKHCRCVKNIWSTLSSHKITYPRIFPKKNTATSGLLQKHLDFKSGDQTVVSLCPECKIASCKHLKTFADKSERSDHNQEAQKHFMVEMASRVHKQHAHARNIQSAPVTGGKSTWHSENTSKVTNTETNEKVFVFGYDFETSSSDDTSFTDESSSDTI